MPARQIAETEMANAGADEFCHFIADFVEHPADLAVQALLQDDTQTGRTHCLQARQPSTFAIKKDAGTQLLPALWIPTTIERDFVFLLDLVAWMSELLGEVPVAR